MVSAPRTAGFPCYFFEDGARGWLMADVEIECLTPDHASVTSLAWIAVIIYPIGLIAMNLLLLTRASKSILAGKETPLTRSIAFLYREYDVTCFWWELMVRLSSRYRVAFLLSFSLTPGHVTNFTGNAAQVPHRRALCRRVAW